MFVKFADKELALITAKKKIFWIDQHPAFNTNVNPQILSGDFAQVFPFHSPSEAETNINKLHPHIIITALRNKNNENVFQFLRKINTAYPETKQLIFTSFTEPWFFVQLNRNNLQKVSIIEKSEKVILTKVLQNICRGEIHRSTFCLQKETLSFRNPVLQKMIKLSDRKWQALFCFAEGMNDKQVAEYLKISPHTANDIRKILYQITETKSKVQYIRFLFRIGFYKIERAKYPKIRG